MNRFTVIQLKEFLRERELPTCGNKEQLISRLYDSLVASKIDPEIFVQDKLSIPQVGVRPKDSVSQIQSSLSRPASSKSKLSTILSNTSCSSIKSDRVMNAANKAALEARKRSMKAREEVEQERIKLKYKEELIEIDTQIEEAAAKEEVFKQAELDRKLVSKLEPYLKTVHSGEPLLKSCLENNNDSC